jgi:monofunctional biosynthetic peptidoglycan transglycosylase
MGKFLSRALLTIILAPILLSLLLVAGLRWMPPLTTSFMLQSPVKPVQYRWVPATQTADVARKAVVASEDQLFWQHHGFDIEAMQKAMEHNKTHRKVRGGSTISQQTAKNLFLWQGGGYLRKGIEAYFTVLIEAMWTKQRILEIYLNVAEFGPGVYGIEAASRKYLGKSAAQLTAADAARLIAVLPSPRHWHVASPGPYVQSRAVWILRQIGYGAPPLNDEEPEPPGGELAPETEDAAPITPPPLEEPSTPPPTEEEAPSPTDREPAPETATPP